MDNITTSKPQLNVLSIVLIKPPDVKEPIVPTQPNCDILFEKVQDITEETVTGQSETFKNLCFTLPTPKRKNDFDEKQSEKRRKVSDDDDDRVFNYLTGIYESVVTATTEESSEDHTDLKEESLIIEEHAWIPDEKKSSFCETGITQFPKNSGNNLVNNEILSFNNGSNDLIVKDEFKSSILEPVIIVPTKSNCSSTSSLVLDFDLQGESPKCLNSADVPNTPAPNIESINTSSSNCSLESNNKSLLRYYLTSSARNTIRLDSFTSQIRNAPIEPNRVILSSTDIITNNNSQLAQAQTSQKFQDHSNTSLQKLLEIDLNSTSEQSKLETCLEKELENITIPLPQYKCQSCSYETITKRDLISHIYNLHLKEDYVMTYKCTQCDFESEDKSDVERHERNHGGLITSATPAISENRKGNSTVLGNKKLVVVLRQENFNQHLNKRVKVKNSSPDDFIPIRCFDCDEFFAEKQELESHAFRMHSSSLFECNLHSSKHDVRVCSKCSYTLILRNIRRNNIICIEEQDDDASKTTQVSEPLVNDCVMIQIDESSKTTVNVDCDTDQAQTDAETVLSLSGEKIVHRKRDVNKQSEANDTCKAIETDINELNSNDCISSKNVSNSKSTLKFQCFDCQYSVTDDCVQFRCHVVKHIGSKFCCMYHIEAKNEDCLRCEYETVLLNIKTHVRSCLTCGFTTADCTVLENHRQENGCETWTKMEPDPGDLKCFHCEYVTSQKKYLFYHAVDHVDQSFVCKKHCPNKSHACLDCIYENCLANAKRDILYCDKCGFKTAVIEVFDIHRFKVDCDDTSTVAFQKYKCWDCDGYSASTIGELRRHANIHYNSTFSCHEHTSLVDNCSKCVYQAIVNNPENSVSTREEVPEEDHLNCFLCEYKSHKRNLLIYHCKQHSDEQFECSEKHEPTQNDCQKCTFQGILEYVKKSLFVCDKCNFKTFNCFHFKSHTTETCDIIVSSESRLLYKCFDCGSVFRTVHHLKRHAEIHTYSLFMCNDHESFDHTCIQCTYERVVKEITSTFTCQKCGFKTYERVHFQTHEKNYVNCQQYKAKLIIKGRDVEPKPVKMYKCFDCDFSHERLNFIEKHVKVHQGSKFKCDQHKIYKVNCAKCFYVQLLIDGPTPTFSCFDCVGKPRYLSLKALYQHVSSEHRNSFVTCLRHITKAEAYCSKCLYRSVVRNVMGDNVQLTCYDCAGEVFLDESTLKKHIKNLHPGSKFICVEHTGANKIGCNKCLYEKCLKASMSPSFQCYDCMYSNESFNDFKTHIRIEHPKSAFRCQIHINGSNRVVKKCPECFYSSTASNQIKNCYQCCACKDTTFTRLLRLRTHIIKFHKQCAYVCPVHSNGGVNCRMCWFQCYAQKVLEKTEYRCFECCFKARHLGRFKGHIRKTHKESSFKCETHGDAVADKCRKCLHQNIVSEARRVRCYECNHFPVFCGPKHLETHIRQKHIRCVFICHKHSSSNDDCGQCYFQKLMKEIFKFVCWDCDSVFHDKNFLRNHIEQFHRQSNFICNLHAVCPDLDSCNRCVYEEMVWTCITHGQSQGATATTSNDILECFDCDYKTREVHLLKSHIHKAHLDSLFTCTKHSFADISATCRECIYEKLVVHLKEV